MSTRRVLFFLTGTLLWAGVLVALFFTGRSRINTDEGGTGESVSTRSAGESIAPQVTLPMWSADGLPDFTLLNQDNAKVCKADLIGKPWIASFIFTRCAGSCPRVASQLRILQDRLSDVPVLLVSLSVQPEIDTPEVLARYAKNLGADTTKWLFLTGNKDEIHSLIATGFLQYVAPSRSPNPEPGWEVEHSNNLCLVNKHGIVVGKYNSTIETEVAMLRRDATQLAATNSLDGNSEQPKASRSGSEP